MNRRGFLNSILIAAAAPAIVRASSLMQIAVPKIIVPSNIPLMDGETYFRTHLYTGTGSQQIITNSLGWAPSFMMIKSRTTGNWEEISLKG